MILFLSIIWYGWNEYINGNDYSLHIYIYIQKEKFIKKNITDHMSCHVQFFLLIWQRHHPQTWWIHTHTHTHICIIYIIMFSVHESWNIMEHDNSKQTNPIQPKIIRVKQKQEKLGRDGRRKRLIVPTKNCTVFVVMCVCFDANN